MEEPLYKGTLKIEDLDHDSSPLHLRRLKSQPDENLSSTSTTLALSVSCTPPSRLTRLVMFLGFGVLVSRAGLALSPFLSTPVFATSLSTCRVS